MNKNQLIDAIAEESGLNKAQAGKAVAAFIKTVTQAVASGDGVSLVGFGSFKRVERSARNGRNPKTGAAMKIAARAVPRFTAGAGFKDAVGTAKKAKKK